MNKKGFTLIELLIVVTIIGILAVALVPRIIGGSSSARDSRRMTDVQTVASGLEYYLLENGNFSAIGSVSTPVCAATLAADLTGFVKQLPADPLAAQTNTAFSASCAGDYVVLFMTDGSSNLSRYAIAAHMEAAEAGDEAIYNTPSSTAAYSSFTPVAFTDPSTQTPYYIAY